MVGRMGGGSFNFPLRVWFMEYCLEAIPKNRLLIEVSVSKGKQYLKDV